MYRKSASDEWADLIGFLAIYGFIAYGLFAKFGTKSLYITLLIPIVLIVRGLLKNTLKTRRANRALCSHGTVGALKNTALCTKCRHEDIARNIEKIKLEENERARLKAVREQNYQKWVINIRLPEYLLGMHPLAFEELICDLFSRTGYEVELTKYTGDGGIDGYLRKNGELSLLQCKRVKGSVGQPVLRDLYGTMQHERASSGVVVTTGKVSQQAKEWMVDKPIRIIELSELLSLIRENYSEDDVVPESFKGHLVKAERQICPLCNNSLRIVKWKGKNFVGCTNYPNCEYTRTKM